ncbi:MAG TPA: radical SAM protein [Candidatus Nanoarchaeia archaeon]|nr:radical SAM protein [Candidatus Nanoarchaeia archaeon]
MEVTLISPYGNLDNIGIRGISSYLKSKGFSVNLVFLPYETDEGQAMRYDLEYSNQVLQQLAELCKNSNLIGITVMANYAERCKKMTKILKEKTSALVVWGGIHPTFCPKECASIADVVCVGEGEDTFLELCNLINEKKSFDNVKGIAFMKNNQYNENEVRELTYDLDVYPDADYLDMSRHYVLKNNKIVKLTKEIYKNMMWVEGGRRKFMTFTTRGCPHRCTFCCNSTLVKIFKGKGNFIRKRSIERVIKEMENIKEHFPFVEYIGIGDEVFFVRSDDEIREFSEKYKSRINLPLQCEFSPMTVTDSKFKAMIDCGLVAVQMGVQSGSDELNFKMYERYQTQDTVLKAAKIIDRYKDHLDFYCYHFIIGNPLESNKSKIETIKFMFKLPDGFLASFFPLVFYPGAKLTEEARKKGLIKEDDFHYTDGWNVRRWKHMGYLDYLIKVLVFLRNRGVLTHDKKRTQTVLNLTTNNIIVKLCSNKVFLTPVYGFFLMYSRFVHTF